MVRKGEFRAPDSMLAAEHRISPWLALSNFQLLLGIEQHCIESTLPAGVDAGLRVFMAAHERARAARRQAGRRMNSGLSAACC